MFVASRRVLAIVIVAVILAGFTRSSFAQTPIPYGNAISLDDAKRIIAAAEENANKNKWPVAIAVVDQAGFLVAFSRLENTQLGSVEVALQKAKTSAHFRRPTKVFEDMLATGGVNTKILNLPGAIPIEGGLPIVRDGKIIGAIGVSGVKSTEDAVIATAGIDALSKDKAKE
jgi:glc operon protein GlcG